MDKHLPPQVEKILREQRLELVEILQRPDTQRRRFFNLRVRRQEGFDAGDLVLKIFGHGDPSVVSGFEKEAGFLELVSGNASERLGSRVPKFITRGDGRLPWYLREYVEGSFLGDICFDFGIREEFLTDSLREELVAFFDDLRRFSVEISHTPFFSSLSIHGYEWYKNDSNFYREHIESVSAEDLRLIQERFGRRSDLLERAARYLVHGDLYLKNIFWNGRNLKVTDWELLHRGNLAFDVGFIWFLAFYRRDWRDQFLSDFKATLPVEDREEFAELFSLVKLSLALRFIRHSEIMEGMLSGEALKNAKEAKALHLETLRLVLDNK